MCASMLSHSTSRRYRLGDSIERERERLRKPGWELISGRAWSKADSKAGSSPGRTGKDGVFKEYGPPQPFTTFPSAIVFWSLFLARDAAHW